ncbi:hypothetical protein RSAG8_13108, partial [Rhizoctonia solani AG-8 WAC10335]
MIEITTNAILARVEKPSATRTSTATLSELTKTSLSVTQAAPNATSHSDSQPQSELRRSSRSYTRSRHATEGGYDMELAADKQRTARAARTRARNKKNKSLHTHSDTESAGIESSVFASETDNDGRDLSPSPTPIATTDEPEAQTTHGYLKERVSRKFQTIVNNSGMQTLIAVDEAISSDPVHTIQLEEHSAEARPVSTTSYGRGWRGFPPGPPHPPLRGSLPAISTPEPELEGDPDDHRHWATQFSTSQEHVPLCSPLPVHDPNSPFLGYPEGSRCSHSPIPDYPMISQSLGNQSLTGSPAREHVPRPLMHAERSVTHDSTSSKSLGNPIPTPVPACSHEESNVSTSNKARSASQHSRLSGTLQPRHGSTPEPSALGLTPSEPEGRVQYKTPARPQAKRPLETPETPVPARKRLTTTIRSTTGGNVYNGRLNIIEINSERVSNTSLPLRQVSRARRRSAPSQTRQRAKSTTSAGNHATPASQQTGNDNFDLLDGLDEDQFVVDSALKGVLVPTAHELPGWERVIWKDVREVTWAFSMGEGNFQTRVVFASCVGACFSEVIKLKLPNLDTATTAMSDDMLTVILNNLCNARYQDLLRLRKPVQDYFELKNPSTPEERQNNEDRIREIFPNWFHYRDLDGYVDPYEGGILPVALESLFFYGPKAIGAQYPSLFERSNDPKDERKHLAVLSYLATMKRPALGAH